VLGSVSNFWSAELPHSHRIGSLTHHNAFGLLWNVVLRALKLRYSVPLAFPLQAVDLQLVIPVIQTLEAGTHSSTASRPPSSSPSRRTSEHRTSRKTLTAGGGVLEDGSGGVGVPFDPIRIARREEGWDGMLEAALIAWIDKVSLELLSVGK
jgi:hypothetical protein